MGIQYDMKDEIAKVAYELWEKSGRISGRETENWLEAERIVMGRYAEKSKSKKKLKKVITHEKMPVELKKTLPEKIKKETQKKKAPAKIIEKKAESKKEARS